LAKELYTPLIFFGNNIVPQSRIAGKLSIMDINANVSYILGIRYNSDSAGRVFDSIYKRTTKENAGVTKAAAKIET
jgi:hypothetical protein